jgi:hypothetical protein
MKPLKRQKNIANTRFAACTDNAWLLTFWMDAARRAIAGRRFWEFSFSTGGHFRDSFSPAMNKNNLTRHEIFRGKLSRRNNQKHNKQKNHLEERTQSRQNP